MAAKVRTSTKAKQQQDSAPWIPERYADIICIIALSISVFIFLFPATIGSGSFASADNIASESFKPYVEQSTQRGEFPQWMPYIFSGLPSYASLLVTGDRWWDVVNNFFGGIPTTVAKIFPGSATWVAIYYIIYGLGIFLLLRSKKLDRTSSFFGAFSAMFSTFIIVLVIIGHNTKIPTMAMAPYILWSLEKLREKFSIKYLVFLTVAMQLLFAPSHLQVVFYVFCMIGFYFLFELVSRVIKKDDPISVFRPLGLLVVAGALAFATSSDRFLSTQEYTPYSIRGSAPIVQNDQTKQDKSGGLDYNYATNFSFSPGEVLTWFVPNFYGYGKLAYKGPETGNQERHIPTYFGQMPFTDAAQYLGIFVLALAIFGAITRRNDTFVQFLAGVSLFGLLLSFGKNFSLVYDFFYYYVPYFNKFRAPAMALMIPQFTIPLLAGFGLATAIQWRPNLQESQKKLLYGLVGFFGLFLVIGLGYAAVGETGYLSDIAKSQNAGQLPASIHKFIWSQMISDWFVTAFIGLLSAGTLLWFVLGKMQKNVFVLVILVLLVTDLWRVAYRAMEVSDKKTSQSTFRTTDAIQFLQKDKSLFRIADFNAFESPNAAAYFGLQNVHGYHPAKLRVYQDLLDVAGKGQGQVILNPFLHKLMNVKYLLASQDIGLGAATFTSQESPVRIYENPEVLPRAFFVQSVQVADKLTILKNLEAGNFDPQMVAFVEEKLPSTIDSAISTNTVKPLRFENEKIAFEVEAAGNNLLFMSEVYYPQGWTVTIDGQKSEFYKTNFAFRSVIVPKGKHIVEFTFDSPQFELGKKLSMGANGIILLGLLFVIGQFFMNRKKQDTIPDKE
ncbi:MAG: YfhO family protein [Candidatus Kapabacteria bacterium]|nr:YfhO family protein [Candidatus Kapabacteria bacterium]